MERTRTRTAREEEHPIVDLEVALNSAIRTIQQDTRRARRSFLRQSREPSSDPAVNTRVDLHDSAFFPFRLVGERRDSERVRRRRVDTKVEEADEEVLAGTPLELGRYRDLHHVLREGFERRLRVETIVERAADAREPGNTV